MNLYIFIDHFLSGTDSGIHLDCDTQWSRRSLW